ncbi:helix-turn-helix transcriptional regulator [Methylobacter sp.]|uniref:helix-turn-helix domain-containing protein n=1 Tax=Methylobacter sp. TaxID=2051955 RepID=UPI0024889CC9|nr:helix-turn-helix transcriptional regulator [Methylobacter sp.]MDI1279744.1 helix-turn-helix transcriptional regulator [Methylobacter sp.]MDI1360412.1 helix-turn-helix transcriptional regulator [Methylobacter sp.]
MVNDTYQPVPHDAAFREHLLNIPAVKADYEANITKYAILDEILSARREAGLTQAQVAERMGTKASAVARLESALVSGKHSPSIDTLRKYAAAVGKKLEVHLV